MSETAEVLWWVFLATFLAVVVLVGGLGIAMVRAQRRIVALHRSYLQRLVKAHEEERARVAREVHDDAVQRLAYLGRELELFGTSDPTPTPARLGRLDGIRNELQDLADALRKLAHGLHPAALEYAGLNVALTQLAEETHRLHRVRIDLQLPGKELEIHRDVRLALFRIAQEAVRNVVRHARTDVASLTLERTDGAIEMTVQDAGEGFDQTTSRRAGIGLVGIEERARLAGGTARILTSPGKGTRVIVQIDVRQMKP